MVRAFAQEWLADKLKAREAEQADREERVVSATRAASRAAWAAIIVALGSAIAADVQAYAALQSVR